jgi:predicted Zn-dependent protease
MRQAGDRWLGTRTPRAAIDARLSLYDDPLVDGRPGSRPICDDGIPTQRLVLIEAGKAVAGLLDLQTACRYRLPATGHGLRRGYRAPGAGFSNLVLESSEPGTSDLAAAVGDGLMVSEIELGPAPNPERGVFRVAVPWCYRIVGGRIVGRVVGAVLAGDAFRLLERVGAIGTDAAWRGAVRVPSLVLDGVGVTLR